MTQHTREPTSVSGIVADPGRRLPLFVSPSGYDAAAHLSDQDRRVGKLAMQNLPSVDGGQSPALAALLLRNPLMMYQSNPELLARDLAWGDALTKLTIGLTLEEILAAKDANELPTKDPGIRRRLETAMLMIAKIAQLGRDEWVLRVMATLPSWTVSRNQFCHLSQPQSIVWSEEERLALEFTEAVVRQTLSDELFARAQTVWGRKQLLRYVVWIARHDGLHMAINVNISDAERTGPVQAPR